MGERAVTEFPVHPAVFADGSRVCADPRCATLLPADAEICDECGGIRLEPSDNALAMLCGWADGRPVAFKLHPAGPTSIGRSAPGVAAPDIDLSRLPGSGSVHRRHATIELRDGEWRVTQLGSNLLVVIGRDRVVVATGTTAAVRSGDLVDIGGVRLQLVVRI
ncbi:MAG: FHA domain-containing protein [Chloroflexota bacterium]